MADDCKNQATEKPDNAKIAPSSFFKRSVAGDVPGNALYSLYRTASLQRGGSIYSSPLGSVVSAGYSLRGKVRKLCSLFESPKIRVSRPDSPEPDPPFRLPGTEDRVVIYFTSLRSIRKTFQECHSTRMIFRGLGVNVDERDISMDAAYRKELQRVLGENNIGLPQVFIKGKYVGGAEVVRQLVEMGELGRLIKGLPLRRVDPCEGCGDVRFVPCTSCNGSRKVFEHEEDGPTRCLHCNENGLVRCPRCCFS